MVYMQEQFKGVLDATGTCLYNNGLLSWESEITPRSATLIAELTSALIGLDLNVEAFTRFGRRLHNVEKAINTLHGGVTRKDGYPPPRYWEAPGQSGPYSGDYIDHTS